MSSRPYRSGYPTFPASAAIEWILLMRLIPRLYNMPHVSALGFHFFNRYQLQVPVILCEQHAQGPIRFVFTVRNPTRDTTPLRSRCIAFTQANVTPCRIPLAGSSLNRYNLYAIYSVQRNTQQRSITYGLVLKLVQHNYNSSLPRSL